MSSRKMPVSLDLVRGDVLLGSIEIKPEAADFPWQAGAFRPSSAFEEVRSLFARATSSSTSTGPMRGGARSDVRGVNDAGVRIHHRGAAGLPVHDRARRS